MDGTVPSFPLERGTDFAKDTSSTKIAWSCDGNFIACCDDTPGNTTLARVWNVETKRFAYAIANDVSDADRANVFPVAVGFVRDRFLVVVTSTACLLHDAANGALIHRTPIAPPVTRAHVSFFGVVALGYENGVVHALNVAKGPFCWTAPFDAGGTHVLAVAVSRNGFKIAAITHHGECRKSNESALVVWDVCTGAVTHTVQPVSHAVALEWANHADALALVIDGQMTVVRLGPDGTVTRDAAKTKHVEGLTAAWSPDDATVALIAFNEIVLLRADAMGAPPVRTITLPEPVGDGTCITFAPDTFFRPAIATLEYWVPDPSDHDIAPFHPVVRFLE